MATGTRKSRAAKQLARSPAPRRVPESMEFVVFEDNGGAFHWTIRDAGGTTLARSASFVSCADAEQAARRLRSAASSAQLAGDATAELPADLIPRRDSADDTAEAEHWLDEGASFSSETVAEWTAPR